MAAVSHFNQRTLNLLGACCDLADNARYFCASHRTFYIKQSDLQYYTNTIEFTSQNDPSIDVAAIYDLQYFRMKRQHYKNLRYAERIKENQCFIEADGLQKKIRKFNAGKIEGNIDAEIKMREIECFWKEGWEYNHTHHIYLQPKVTKPEFYKKSQRMSRIHPKLEKYYELLEQFVRKLKIENEDETNFKIEEIEYSPKDDYKQMQIKSEMEVQLSEIVEFDDDIEDKEIARLSFLHFLRIIAHVSTQMILSFEQSVAALEDNMMDEGLEESQIHHLKQVAETCEKILQKGENQEDFQQESEQFMLLIMKIIERSKQNKIYSSVAAVQPFIGKISEIIHPISLGLYAVFSKEVLVKDAKKRRGKRYADEYDEKLKLSSSLLKENLSSLKLLKIEDNFKVQQEKHSKVVFLNLDGYESQFNLEFIRNFADNIMYASFPKFDKKEESKHYNYRFYKKIMYNFTRSELDILGFPEEEELQGINLTLQRENLLLNPQKYHETVDEIYRETDKVEDFNRNTYVFPINLDHIQSEYDISKNDKHIQGYQSHFVRFILRDQLYSAMKNFRPHSIFISYTGRITIQNEHFVEMMQELVKICPKIILFPNFTNSLNQSSNQPKSLHQIGKGIIVNDDESELERKANEFYEKSLYNPYQIDLMDKISIFLKVTAGYYNVIRPFQQQDIYSKYKNSRIFRYIIHLYSGLKNQYEHCKRRIQSSTLQTARACLENTLNQNSKQIVKCIPEYYKQMFDEIRRLLQGQIHGDQYNSTVDQVRDQFPATFEEEQPYLLQWEQLKKAEVIQLASAKYHEMSQIQIRQKSSKQEYLSLKDQRMNNLNSLYRISFFYKDQSNEIVKIYKDVTLLYKENQYPYNKSYFYIALTNLFTSNQRDITHYIAKPKLGSKKLQRCQIIPICFYDRGGIIAPAHKFKVWTEWNYTETNHHVILYWPTDFDFIHYYLSKLLKRKYEPRVIQRVFAANKSSDSLGKTDSTFYQINFGENVDVAPRWGCSGLNIDDQMYIFGGSYGSQMSYLNLQNDISTFDLTDHNLQDFAPTKLRNLRKQLYCDEAFWGKLREKKDVNTFVRPRIELQFYDREELVIDDDDEIKKQEDYRKIYMIGGYGEQFKTPYSLFVNYYYQLLIQKSTRRLVSIKKCVVPDKVIPINVKDMIKNRGIYQKANILQASEGKDKEQQKCKEGITNNRHYFCHKVVYALKAEQLQFKIKNLFAIQIYENCKKQFMNVEKRLVSVKTEEPESVLIRKVEGSKHQVLVDIGDIYYLYSLYLELSGDELEEIPLMNESIISLDTKKLTIFALISHSKHTQSKCILASETVSLPSQSIIDKEKHYALILKEIATFEESLNLHTLIICNVHEVVLLHGVAFQNCQPKEYLIKTKSQNKNQLKREEIRPLTVSHQQVNSITTFFAKKNNIITSINFLQSSQNPHFFSIASYSLDINRFAEGWKPKAEVKMLCFVHRKTVLQKITIQARIDNYADINNVIILIYMMKKAYHIKMSELFNAMIEIEVEELTDKKEIERYKCMECLAKLIKNEELYEDFNYFG